MQNLTPEQAAEYTASGHFHVRGGTSGRRYRIRHGVQLNVDLLDDHSKVVSTLCFVPTGNLVEGDILLAQKLALELCEPDVLKVANWSLGSRIPLLLSVA